MGITIGWLCGTNEDGRTTNVVMGGRIGGGMGAFYKGRVVAVVSSALPPDNIGDPAISIVFSLVGIDQNY